MAGHVPAESNALSERTRESNGLFMSASAPADSFFVYILRCADGSLYVGHTSNVEDRIRVHNEGRGALWTACRRPVTLAYCEQQPSEDRAIERERQIKRWSHAKKLALIDGDPAKLKSLARRRGG
jgi:predicted GIY-YIG superfamily endonuclease